MKELSILLTGNRDMTAPSAHRNGNIVILTNFLSLVAPNVVKTTTCGSANDENFIIMTIFSFQNNGHPLGLLDEKRCDTRLNLSRCLLTYVVMICLT